MAKRGRKEFRATAALKRKVAECAFAGMSQNEIALVIGCSTPTLMKHFAVEWHTGVAQKRAEVVGWMFREAKAGNVSAQRKLAEIGAITQATRASEQTGADSREARDKANTGKLGKKKLAQIAATQVGGEDSEWGDLLDPESLPN
jgi:hypothetical protein